MDSLIAWIAQYLLWLMVAGFAIVWLLLESTPGKIQSAVQTVLGLGLAVAFLYIAKHAHHDPRPFVQNPHIKPLFHHGPDDGFPSDHSIAAGLIATLVLIRHRAIGVIFAAAAVALAWARVAAHVHHLQDVVAGLILGALAAVIAVAVAPPLIRWASRYDRRRKAPSNYDHETLAES